MHCIELKTCVCVFKSVNKWTSGANVGTPTTIISYTGLLSLTDLKVSSRVRLYRMMAENE